MWAGRRGPRARARACASVGKFDHALIRNPTTRRYPVASPPPLSSWQRPQPTFHVEPPHVSRGTLPPVRLWGIPPNTFIVKRLYVGFVKSLYEQAPYTSRTPGRPDRPVLFCRSPSHCAVSSCDYFQKSPRLSGAFGTGVAFGSRRSQIINNTERVAIDRLTPRETRGKTSPPPDTLTLLFRAFCRAQA